MLDGPVRDDGDDDGNGGGGGAYGGHKRMTKNRTQLSSHSQQDHPFSLDQQQGG